MGILLKMNLFFKLLTVILIFLVFCFSAIATADDTSDYEKNYPQYVNSTNPLAEILANDLKDMRKSNNRLLYSVIPSSTTVSYGKLKVQQLDIYRLPGEGLNPVIFFIHGGRGDKGNVFWAVNVWMSLGYTVVSINHRSVPDNSFPEMVEDCNRALKWVMENIQVYAGDSDRIAVTGISCGGHLAALLITDTKSQQKYGIDISKVACWFPMSGFYDMSLKENLISPHIKKYIELICVPSKQNASPSMLATGKEPPCLIIHGGDDWCVPKTNAISLFNHLDKDKTTLAILNGYMHANIFSCYSDSGHEPAKLIKNFLATHLPTEKNH